MAANPPIWLMVRQAIEALGGEATNQEIRAHVQKNWQGVHDPSVSAHINLCTVNSPSRIQYPQNSKPRIANGRYDFLFKLDRGLVALYDPKIHGAWEIRAGLNGKPKVGMVADDGAAVAAESSFPAQEQQEAEEPSNGVGLLFPLERHLRDFLAANIRSVDVRGSFLALYTDESGQTGVEYPTDVGPIDLLAVDATGDFFVFELKLGRGPDVAIGQLARYMGWVKRNLAGDRCVTGVIVAKTADDKLRYAASVIPDVILFEYAMSFTLHPADEVR
jgi:endonuclease